MTPAARISAAIEILDEIQAGVSAERALTAWARRSRFAGSGDRAAIRDHVFDALRNWRSDAARGGGETGRLRMLGRLRAVGQDPATIFTGEGHAPDPLSEEEEVGGRAPEEGAEALDLPDWLWPQWRQSLGSEAEASAQALKERGPVTLRVNTARQTRAGAIRRLREDGITATANERAYSALTVTDGARKVRNSQIFVEGRLELQDASSQAAVLAVPAAENVLDFCAGGGGKALAFAARGATVTAYDAAPERMADIPARAARAGVEIRLMDQGTLGPKGGYDLVFCDAPCSGSGTWRRTPEAKISFAPERLEELMEMQLSVLREAKEYVAEGGILAYATCSVLRAENEDRVEAFCAEDPAWQILATHHWSIDAAGDGFFLILLTREL